MRLISTDTNHFKRRLSYRLQNEPVKKYALQERLFQDGYHLIYKGKEFTVFGYDKVVNQVTLQSLLSSYVKNYTYQLRLPF